MTTYPFRQVDVFCAEPPAGNALAVVAEADGLTDAQMAEFARWTNLSETTFLLPPTAGSGADYRVRIWTPSGELPFAGHPTIGSCHAWLEAGGRPATPGRVVQECGLGLVTLRLGGGGNDRDGDDGRSGGASFAAFAAPPLLRSGPVDPTDVRRAVAGLGLAEADYVDAAWCDNGPGWLGILVRSADAVLALRPDPAALGELAVGVIGPYPAGAPAHVEVRAFAPAQGVPEDPVTGSLNAALAQWLVGTGRLPTAYVAAQGTVLHRRGRVYVEADAAGTIWVGGAARTVIRGTVELGA